MDETNPPSFWRKPVVRICVWCAGVLTLLVGFLVANYVMRDESTAVVTVNDADLDAILSEASELYDRELFDQALHVLRPIRHVLFVRNDIPGLKLYADCRAAVANEANSHIKTAAALYVRIADLDPTDVDVRVRLFQLFRELEDHDAAVRYGDEAVELKPDDHRLRLNVAQEHLLASRTDEARKHAEHVLQAEPRNIAAASVLIRSMAASGVASPEIMTAVEDLYSDQTSVSDRVDRTLLLLAAANETNDKASAELLTSLLKPEDFSTSPSRDRSEMLAAAFAASGRTLDALRAVEQSVDDTSADPKNDDQSRFVSLLYRYLWAEEHQKLLKATEQLPDSESEEFSEVVVIRFFSLWIQRQHDELSSLVQRLEGHESHRARSWTPVLQALAATQPMDQDVLAATKDALTKYPQSPILRHVYAEAFQSLGDYDAAIAEYRRAVRMAPRWGSPRYALARLLVSRGNLSMAFYEALEGARAVPHSRQALQSLSLCATKLHSQGRLDKDTCSAIAQTIGIARDASDPGQARQILDATFHFLQDDVDGVRAATTLLLENPQDLALDEYEFLSTIADSDADRKRIDDCRMAANGKSVSEILAQAVRTAREQGETAASEYLATAKVNGNLLFEGTRDLLFAEVLSAINSTRAKTNWIQLAEKYTTDVRAQQRVLAAKELENEFAVRRQVVNNIKAASPDDSVLWKVESARLLLDSDESQQAAAQVALDMSKLLKTAPLSKDATLFAVEAFHRLEKPERVLAACRNARAQGLLIPSLLLRTAELSTTRDEAVNAARSLLSVTANNSSMRERAIVVLLHHRDFGFAADEIARGLPKEIADTDDHFRQFSTLAMALAKDGTVTKALGPIEALAPTSDRWFQLWLDISRVSSVLHSDAAAMLDQAGGWLAEAKPDRNRKLAVAWRQLANRSPNPKCLQNAFETLRPVVDENSPAQEHMLLAGLALKVNQKIAAVQIYEEVVAHHSVDDHLCSIALNNLAALKSDDPAELDKANELANRAWMLHKQPEFVDTMVEIRLRMNRKEDALELLQEGIRTWPDDSRLKRIAARLNPPAPQENEG